MTSKLRTKVPFDDSSNDNGWLHALARAQPHSTTKPQICPPGWHSRKAPLKVAVIADMHVGSHPNDLLRFEHIVDEINVWRPDVVLLLGDFMHTRTLSGRQVIPEIIASILGSLQSRLGAYAVLGNHDWRYDGPVVRRALEARSIMVLENSSHKVTDVSGEFWIAGLADAKTRSPQVEQTLSSVPEGTPALIMAHDPAIFEDVSSGPYLTVCGHTHGGQIRLPVIGPLTNSSRAPLKWTSGHIVEDGKHLYVCRGLGTSLIPLRLNCPPELCFMSVGP